MDRLHEVLADTPGARAVDAHEPARGLPGRLENAGRREEADARNELPGKIFGDEPRHRPIPANAYSLGPRAVTAGIAGTPAPAARSG
ncbi:MAG: hypothetical protein GF355_14990 [Candidatus Eisenbacteria bacterium]|nr:hypothetical protein [Candidatus Eisenbacteria bacterium]